MNTNILSETNSLNNELIRILQSAQSVGSDIYTIGVDGLGKVTAFAQEQIPLVATEFLKWKFLEDMLWIVIGLTIMFLFWTFSFRLFKSAKRTGDSDTDFGAWIVLVMGTILPMIFCILPHTFDALKIKSAPKLYLIEKASSIIQRHR